MFNADGGASGQQRLHVDPWAIPQAKAAFVAAFDQLETELRSAGYELQAREWAEDPVSRDTAQKFNQDTFDAGDRAALTALEGYRDQLRGVIDQLTRIESQYRVTEGDNAALWGRHHSSRTGA